MNQITDIVTSSAMSILVILVGIVVQEISSDSWREESS